MLIELEMGEKAMEVGHKESPSPLDKYIVEANGVNLKQARSPSKSAQLQSSLGIVALGIQKELHGPCHSTISPGTSSSKSSMSEMP